MKYLVFLALLQLVTVLQAIPQEGSLLKRLLNSDENPCGAGVRPSCRCASNLDLAPEAATDCPEGPKDLQCFCPGTTEEVDLESIKAVLKEALVSSPRNPCGAGNEMTCVCANGDEAEFGSGPPCPSGRTKIVALPTCTCPDGSQVENIREMILRMRELFNFKEHVDHKQESILALIHMSDRNPCGANIRPSCTCKSDNSVVDKIGECPEGFTDMDCECPNGKQVDVGQIVEIVGQILVNDPRNPCGKGKEISCVCENGKEATFAPGAHCPQNKLPTSCTCPDGTQLEDIQRMIQNIDMQFLLQEDQDE